jgi:hypothetical protein
MPKIEIIDEDTITKTIMDKLWRGYDYIVGNIFDTKYGMSIFSIYIYKNYIKIDNKKYFEKIKNIRSYENWNFRMYERVVMTFWILVGLSVWCYAFWRIVFWLTKDLVENKKTAKQFREYLFGFFAVTGVLVFVFYIIGNFFVNYQNQRDFAVSQL